MDSTIIFSQSHNHHTEDYNKEMTNSSSSYSVWNDFFLLAGIPNTVAHEYAVTFSQHRIRINMLKEITKEILLDMGIKAMGDIIAILRHAKNLYTRDELQGGTKSTAPTVTNTIVPTKKLVVNELAHRTPITTSRNGPSISSLVGNKVQSRVNMNSGALIASSNNSTSNSDLKNKRHSSTISNSMAKRLKPAGQTNFAHDSKSLPEKTLTVHYPSGSAIAKAQQRVLGSTSASFDRGRAPAPASIKSRLGSIEESSRNGPTAHHGNRQNWSGDSTEKHNAVAPSRSSSTSSFSSKRRHESGRDKQERHQPGRLKSTVFRRLGGDF